MARLDSVCTINMGQSPESSSYNQTEEGIPFFQGNADFGRVHPHVRIWCNAPAKIAHDGDILISVRAPIGALNIADRECCIGRGLAALTTNEQICVKEYLWYCISSQVDELNAKGTGSTFKAINKNALAETEIPLPCLNEQRNIAELLDKVTNLICIRKQQLEQLDLLVKSRFVEMFGELETNPFKWPCMNLQQLFCSEPQNGLYKPQSDYVEDGKGIPILRIDAFYNGKVKSFVKLKRLLCSDAELTRYLLFENDIVINRVNSIEYLGKCALIKGLKEPTVFESNMMRFHLNEKMIEPQYATHVLCSKYIYNQILRRAKKAVNQASINQNDVQSFCLPVPSLELQQGFSAFVTQIDKSKAAVQKSLDQLETLKKELMQKYFG